MTLISTLLFWIQLFGLVSIFYIFNASTLRCAAFQGLSFVDYYLHMLFSLFRFLFSK
jgi:hypothetical protein